MYNQLMDVMSRLDSFEEKYKQGTAERKEENKVLKKENRSEVVYGENVKVLATMLYSEGVMSKDRIADFLNAAGNGERNLSTGSIYQFCKALAGNAKRSMEHLEEELLNQRIAAADAAVITNNGVQCYIRIFSITGAVFRKNSREHESMTMRLRCIIIKKQNKNMQNQRNGLYGTEWTSTVTTICGS